MRKYDDIDSYIEKIENSISLSEEREERVKEMIQNLLEKFKTFKDTRSINPQYIMALTELIDMHQSAPIKRATLYKNIIDIMIKLKELDMKIKEKEKKEVGDDGVASIQKLLAGLRESRDFVPQITDDKDLIAIATVEEEK